MMDPRSGDFVSMDKYDELSALEREAYTLRVEGLESEIEEASRNIKGTDSAQKVIDKLDPEVVEALNRYRDQFSNVRSIAKKASRSGHPGLRKAGEDILAVLA